MRRFAAILVLACALGAQAPAQSGLGLIQPDAGVIIGIEWRKIVDSGVGAELTDQIKKTKTPLPGMEVLQEALLHDLDSIVIAAPASVLGTGSRNARPPVLVVVKGRFRADQFQDLAKLGTKGKETYRSVEMLILPDDTPSAGATGAPAPMRLALLDAGTILLGDRDQMRGAIDRMKTGRLTAPHGGNLGGAAELALNNDLWMIFDLPAGAMKDAPSSVAQMFAPVKGAELGMSFRNGFGLLVNIRTKDAESATSMAQALQGLLALGAMSQPQTPQTAELVKKIRITPEASRVSLALSLDRAEVQKMIEEMKAGAAKAQSAPAVAPTARAPEPPGPKKIRITGLESGTVEVPVQNNK